MVEGESQGRDAETRSRSSNSPELVPRIIGPYRIIQKVGEGGMGEVFEAEQETPVRRRVALKVIKRGLETNQVLARFEAERQALALMDHPCVAKVFDAGETERGRPYFAMEFVQGVPITEHCDRHRLSTGERLELFIPVCEGIQHAHQKAVIHRDIKPTNVLVTIQDGTAVPKIIDFGVAKAVAQPLTARTLFTEMGQLIGTPAYMSPEQAEMTGQNVDTRTDVYSLGAMLYELLVGAAPFDSAKLKQGGPDGIRRMIREIEPPKPSTRASSLGEGSETSARNRRTIPRILSGQLRGDLDWITMKALEKDRTRRYASPLELAADVRRHLRNEAVSASPPSRTYRVGKFVRRHRVGVGVALGVGALLLAFGLTMTIQAGRIAAERDRANRAHEESEAVVGFLSDMLAAVDPGEAGREVTVREVVDETAAKVGSELHGQPGVEARIRHTMGATYRALGHADEAALQAERALEIRKELLGPEDPETLETGHLLAMIEVDRGRYEEAEVLFRETYEARRRVLGEEHPSTITAMSGLARTHWHQGRYDEAETLNREALERCRRVLGDEHLVTLVTMKNLGAGYLRDGRYEEAEAIWLEHLGIERRVLGDEHPETLGTMNNLAITYSQQGRHEEAVALLKETLAIRRRVLGEEHPKTISAMGNLAAAYSAQGRYEDALPLKRRTLEIQRRVLGEEHPNTLLSMHNLANAYWSHGRLDEAEALLREAVEMQRRVLGEEHPDTNDTRYNLACLAAVQGRPREALQMLRVALEHGDWTPPTAIADDPDLASLHGDPDFEAILVEMRRRNEESEAAR